MQVSVEAVEGLQKKMTIEVPAERVQTEVKKRLKSMRPNLKIQGFRPGKVPMSIVEKRYGGQVLHEVTGELINSSFYEAVNNENLKPAGMPKIEPVDSATGDDLKFTAVFEVYPEIALSDVSQLSIEKSSAEITDADIDNMVEKLRSQRTEWVAVDRAAKDGDQVICDYNGTVDGESFAGGDGTDLPVVLGSNSMISGFEDGLTGSEKDQTIEMDLTFPENYQSADIAGKDVHFSVTVKGINEANLPEVDEEFIKEFGVEEGDVPAFRDELKNNMQRELDRVTKSKVKNKIMEALLEANEIEVPVALIDAESERVAEQMNEQMNFNQTGGTVAAASFEASQFKDQGERRVKLGLLLSEIIKQNELKASPEKVRAEIESIATAYNDPKEVVTWYYQDKNRLTEIESMVLEDQVVDWVLEHGQVVDNMTTFDEIMKDSR